MERILSVVQNLLYRTKIDLDSMGVETIISILFTIKPGNAMSMFVT